MESFYFTFGYGQEHSKHYVIIEAENSAASRVKMFEMHGSEWAFQYNEKDWFKNGISQADEYDYTLLATYTA